MLHLTVEKEGGLVDNIECHDYIIKENGTLLITKNKIIFRVYAHRFWKSITIGQW